MARNSTSRGTRSSSPSKASAGGDNPGLSAWREFYAREAAKIKAENPGMKGKTVQKRVSTMYRKWKEENGDANH